MKQSSPILVLVYDRLACLKKCIASLQLCKEAEQATIYISSDAAYKSADEEKIDEVRNYIKTITNFKEVIPIFHEKNMGLLGSYNFATTQIFKTHQSFIFLEDDIIVAPNFLEFMNKGLKFYENDPRVIAISGFSHSVFFDVEPKLKSQVYFTNRWCPWGFATWKNKILEFEKLSNITLRKDLSSKEFVQKLDKIGIDLLTAFKIKCYRNETLVLDYYYVYNMIKNNFYTVTPYTTKTFNLGNDGNGTRTQKNEKYVAFDTTVLQNVVPFKFTEFEEHKINNDYNFILNFTKKNKFKRLLDKLGLLQLGYFINDIKQKWKKRK